MRVWKRVMCESVGGVVMCEDVGGVMCEGVGGVMCEGNYILTVLIHLGIQSGNQGCYSEQSGVSSPPNLQTFYHFSCECRHVCMCTHAGFSLPM